MVTKFPNKRMGGFLVRPQKKVVVKWRLYGGEVPLSNDYYIIQKLLIEKLLCSKLTYRQGI